MKKSEVMVLEKKWFNSESGCIGVVFAFDKKQKTFYGYIGVGYKIDEVSDANFIINHGCKLTQEETFFMIGSSKAQAIIKTVKDERWGK